MGSRKSLSRREFLRLSALTAVGASLVACGGAEPEEPSAAEEAAVSPPPVIPEEGQDPAADEDTIAATTPTQVEAPSSYGEAPMLAERVEAGDLPPVEERLPTTPYVPPHQWLEVGKYGGTMQMSATSTDMMANSVHELMYGHSPLRWLDDGLAIGPGLVESWESNDETTEWTLHFREGLKWSDGQPWTTADIMYWWEDLVLDEGHPDTPPDEARSGKGTLATIEAVDDYTLRMTFDAPAPLTADRLAMWVNAGIGPRWMAPRHYLEQFHPTYNDEYSDFVEHDIRMNFRTNPECPTMTGWRLQSYEEGVRAVWERNPFYWVVDQEGNQLPYIDGIVMTGVQDQEVNKLQILEGQIDWAQFHGLSLRDVSALREAQPRSGVEPRFWDSGSGTGTSIFFNYDYQDEKMRQLIREPKFRQALSHACNRPEIQKVIYFNTGEQTTGTFSPKAIEYNFNDEAKQVYQSWRDSYVEYDPEKAKALLDEIGVTDQDGDGFREMPDGSKLNIRQDHVADTSDDVIAFNEILRANWRDVGINTDMNPIPPSSFANQWRAGELMTNAHWGIGDGPNHLVFPQWLVPIEQERWAPLHGTWYAARGTAQETVDENVDPWERQPPRIALSDEAAAEPIDRLWQIYDQSRIEPDAIKRHHLVWDMIKIHVEEGPFVQGTVANFPRLILVKQGLLNVPVREDLALGGFTDPWIHPTAAVYDPEAWYWDDPEAHR